MVWHALTLIVIYSRSCGCAVGWGRTADTSVCFAAGLSLPARPQWVKSRANETRPTRFLIQFRISSPHHPPTAVTRMRGDLPSISSAVLCTPLGLAALHSHRQQHHPETDTQLSAGKGTVAYPNWHTYRHELAFFVFLSPVHSHLSGLPFLFFITITLKLNKRGDIALDKNCHKCASL